MGGRKASDAARGAMKTLLVTGAAGLIGRVLVDGLSDRYEVRGVDRAAPRSGPLRRRDLRKPDALDGLLAGADAVIDLAGLSSTRTPWADVHDNNVPVSMNVLEAARRAAVKRVIFASSNHVTGMYEADNPYAAIVAGTHDDLDPCAIPHIHAGWPIRPDSPYGIGKALGEAAGRYYADTFGLSVLCLRIGTVNAADRPLETRHFATLLTHADLLRLVTASVEGPEALRFGIYYGVSQNTWRFWDLTAAQAAIGFEPQDDAESFRAAG